MTLPKTIILSRNTLAIRGLVQLIHVLQPDPKIETYSSLQQVPSFQQNEEEVLVFISQECFTRNSYVRLEKMYHQNPRNCFVALTAEQIPEQLQVIFEHTINPNESENQILDQLRNIYGIQEGSAAKYSGNTTLSERETEVLRTVALGMTNKEISDTLYISTHTVITHRKNITAKLGIKTIAGLAVYAVLNGIITADEMENSNL